jgi:citrate lyase beta subunit
MLETAV